MASCEWLLKGVKWGSKRMGNSSSRKRKQWSEGPQGSSTDVEPRNRDFSPWRWVVQQHSWVFKVFKVEIYARYNIRHSAEKLNLTWKPTPKAVIIGMYDQDRRNRKYFCQNLSKWLLWWGTEWMCCTTPSLSKDNFWNGSIKNGNKTIYRILVMRAKIKGVTMFRIVLFWFCFCCFCF